MLPGPVLDKTGLLQIYKGSYKKNIPFLYDLTFVFNFIFFVYNYIFFCYIQKAPHFFRTGSRKIYACFQIHFARLVALFIYLIYYIIQINVNSRIKKVAVSRIYLLKEYIPLALV